MHLEQHVYRVEDIDHFCELKEERDGNKVEDVITSSFNCIRGVSTGKLLVSELAFVANFGPCLLFFAFFAFILTVDCSTKEVKFSKETLLD